MAKTPKTLKVKLPDYLSDRKDWRREINAAAAEKQRESRVTYTADDKLEVQVRLHLRDRKLTVLDLDNRLKQIFDALQGFNGDKGKRGGLVPIIPNDNQIYRVIVEKRLAPKVDRKALGVLVIQKYRNHPGTARAPREFRKKVGSPT
jgi:Holliday junction resolvase RusA-like endonuclease